MKLPSCLSCFSLKALRKSKKGVPTEVPKECERCLCIFSTPGFICPNCTKTMFMKRCASCNDFVHERKHCVRCTDKYPELAKNKNTSSHFEEANNNLLLVNAAYKYFVNPTYDFGECFDLKGEYLKNIRVIPKHVEEAFAKNKKYCFYFIEAEPNYWILSFVRLNDNGTCHCYFICPGNYIPQTLHNYILPRVNPYFSAFNRIDIINAGIHAFGFPTLLASILTAIGVTMDLSNPDNALSRSRACWVVHPECPFPVPGYDPLKGDVLDDDKIRKLLSAFSRILMKNDREIARNMDSSEEIQVPIERNDEVKEYLEEIISKIEQEQVAESNVEKVSIPNYNGPWIRVVPASTFFPKPINEDDWVHVEVEATPQVEEEVSQHVEKEAEPQVEEEISQPVQEEITPPVCLALIPYQRRTIILRPVKLEPKFQGARQNMFEINAVIFAMLFLQFIFDIDIEMPR